MPFELLTKLRQEMEAFERIGFKDAVSGTPSLPNYSGPGGMFGVLGLNQQVISTAVQPLSVADKIPVRQATDITPQFPYLTGFINDNPDTPPDGPCDDPPDVGHGKSCIQSATFGNYSYQTRVLDIRQPGRTINRGEFRDLVLVNPPFESGGSILHPDMPGFQGLDNEVFFRMTELGIEFQRKLSHQFWEGNPVNSTNGGYAEFPGLNILIGTGKIDFQTATPCPSLDSLMIDFHGAQVDFNGGDNLVNVLSYMMRYLKTLADRTKLSEVRHVLAMREQLFHEITAIWPCAYMTYRCQPRVTDGTITQMISPSDQIAMRDAMRNGRYLIIDGIQFNVEFDDAIPADAAGGGCFDSDIYILPLTIRNGTIASLYWEHMPYDQTAIVTARDMRVGQYFFTDGGRFLWHVPPPNNLCVQLRAWIEPRVILRTPHLAARLQNVRYCPLINPREPYPDDDYFVNGGFYGVRAPLSGFTEWGLI